MNCQFEICVCGWNVSCCTLGSHLFGWKVDVRTGTDPVSATLQYSCRCSKRFQRRNMVETFDSTKQRSNHSISSTQNLDEAMGVWDMLSSGATFSISATFKILTTVTWICSIDNQHFHCRPQQQGL